MDDKKQKQKIFNEIEEGVEKGDPYDQIKEAERRGVLSKILLNALQEVSDDSWNDFNRQWKDHWSSYLIDEEADK